MSNQQEIRMYTRARSRRRMLDVDLNAAPPCEIREHGVVSHHTRSQDRQDAVIIGTLPPPIDVEALDDDVIISSPTAFAEAKNNSRRNRGRAIIVDVDNDERASRNKRRRVPTNQTIINCDLYINLESSSNSMRKSGQTAAVPPKPPVPPKEPTFSCPVCMGPLVEEMSTKCGHIFCKACIKASIAAQGKCPTCRRKTTAKDIIRVYLPSTRSA
ncbi:uncharacterized protein LOC131023453 [Salvia miltiorrhiza]|uniref:uncharacterized protein LOC131023453 n=1 Tax=Salvia miltiorrhiza TaxID=226208 RepID=UPI0025AD1F0F|nr:uncharacterized protein LOC131023453 [Salvia miltiorrhiza]XP_057808981.1 uncharacterized protein LOC131023453 [Salvia miltiorrhiza]